MSMRIWQKIQTVPRKIKLNKKHTLKSPLNVAVLALENRYGEILLSFRKKHQHQGGLWEFPGGKVEKNETAEEALLREIGEELAYSPNDFTNLIQITHQYSDICVKLYVFYCKDENPLITAAEKQSLKWVKKQRLHLEQTPAADKAIIDAIQLPSIIKYQKLKKTTDIHLLNRLADTGLWIDITGHSITQQERIILMADKKRSDHIFFQPLPDIRINKLSFNRHLSTLDIKHHSTPSTNHWTFAHCKDLGEVKKAIKYGCDFVIFCKFDAKSKVFDWQDYQKALLASSVPVYATVNENENLRENLNRAKKLYGQGLAIIPNQP